MSRVLTPASLPEALDFLAHYPEAQPLAGGTDLLVRRRAAGSADARPLLAIAHLPELRGIRDDGTHLFIGAATPFATIAADPRVQASAPVLARAARCVGGPALRNMATLGGNIRTASPAGDSLPPLYAFDASVELASARATRRVPIERFILGPGKTALNGDELITGILLPSGKHAPCPVKDIQCFEKVGRRESMAISVASFCAIARLDDNGCLAEARFSWGSVGPTVVRLPALESALRGARPDAENIGQAVQMAHDGVSPISDLRASAAYRRRLAGNLLARFLEGVARSRA